MDYRPLGLNYRYSPANFQNLQMTRKIIQSPACWAAAVLLGLAVFLIWDQQHWWGLQAEYAFGYIVPLFVGFVIYDRWPLILQHYTIGEDSNNSVRSAKKSVIELVFEGIALLGILGGLMSFLLGALYKTMEGNNLISSNLLASGFVAILLCGTFYFADRVETDGIASVRSRIIAASLFLFPALIWLLSVPMFSVLEKGISTFLMDKVAVIVYTIFDTLGYAILREGSILRLPLGDVGVEDACSGIRSLMASLFAGSFLAAVTFKTLWKKVTLVFTAMLFAFINNIFRSLFLTAWAYAEGPEGLEQSVLLFGVDLGNVHDLTGWVVLGLTVGCLLLLVKIFSIQFTYQLKPEEIS
jgi:exosortase